MLFVKFVCKLWQKSYYMYRACSDISLNDLCHVTLLNAKSVCQLDYLFINWLCPLHIISFGQPASFVYKANWFKKIHLNWSKEVKPHLIFSHRLNTKSFIFDLSNF